MSGLPQPEWGLVTLNGVELDAPGRLTLNSWVLTDGAKRRRKNRTRPGVDGQKGSRGFKDPRDVTLEVFLDGRWDADGDPVNTAVHLATAAILDDPGDAEGCVTCSVTTAVAGTTHDGPVQVDDLRADPGIGAQVVTFSLCILRGELAITAGSG